MKDAFVGNLVFVAIRWADLIATIAAGIIAVQLPLSAWWLSRYRFGPVEWIWRRLTYRQPLAPRA